MFNLCDLQVIDESRHAQLMSVYLKLVDLYRRNGFQVRTGLYPPHFGNFKGASGTVLEKDSLKLRTGGGIALGEVYLLEELCAAVQPRRIFIIGNAFGWSTFAFAYACPEARVVALDAGVEGNDNRVGIDLTNEIARQENMNVRCVYGFSPQEVAPTLAREMSDPPDFVFIDGLHTNQQLMLDFEASHAVAPGAVYLYHDIVYCKMQRAFGDISAKLAATHDTCMLWRTYSGIGLSVPKHLTSRCKALIEAYTDDPGYIKTVKLRWRVLHWLDMLGPVGTLLNRIAAKFDHTLQKLTRRPGTSAR